MSIISAQLFAKSINDKLAAAFGLPEHGGALKAPKVPAVLNDIANTTIARNLFNGQGGLKGIEDIRRLYNVRPDILDRAYKASGGSPFNSVKGLISGPNGPAMARTANMLSAAAKAFKKQFVKGLNPMSVQQQDAEAARTAELAKMFY